jgi:hypothetical protein
VVDSKNVYAKVATARAIIPLESPPVMNDPSSWPHRILATIAIALVACAASPSRLDPVAVSGIRRTVVRSYIPEKDIQIRKHSGVGPFFFVPVPMPGGAVMVVGPGPGAIIDAVRSAAIDRRVAALRAVTGDVDFPRQYWDALERTLTDVDWLKFDKLQRSGWTRRQMILSQEVAEHGLLVTETRFALSEDSTILQMGTALFFYPQDHSGDPAATTLLYYQSERVGPEPDDAAIAAWSAVEDQPDRVILRTDKGSFLSLPRAALQPRESPEKPETKPPP